MLHPDHREEILITQVALEVVFLRKASHPLGLQKLVVQGRVTHGIEVQKHYAAVEARQTVWWRVTHTGLGILFAVLPESVPTTQREDNAKKNLSKES